MTAGRVKPTNDAIKLMKWRNTSRLDSHGQPTPPHRATTVNLIQTPNGDIDTPHCRPMASIQNSKTKLAQQACSMGLGAGASVDICKIWHSPPPPADASFQCSERKEPILSQQKTILSETLLWDNKIQQKYKSAIHLSECFFLTMEVTWGEGLIS